MVAIIIATIVRYKEQVMPKGVPLTEQEVTKRRHEIFHRVVGVFLKQGFQETSMREIADAAGLGKSTLYDYFRTKDDILLYYFEDQLNDLTEAAQQIAMQNIGADERLRQVTRMHMEFLQANKSLFMKMSLEAQRLKLDSQKKIQDKRHIYQDLIRALIDEGIREGAFRQVNSLLVARMLISSLAPLVYTSRPTGTAQDMVAETLDILYNGMQA
jgi:TetR/AcrR family transcriptional regulator, cholesterol catabolism regulator